MVFRHAPIPRKGSGNQQQQQQQISVKACKKIAYLHYGYSQRIEVAVKGDGHYCNALLHNPLGETDSRDPEKND